MPRSIPSLQPYQQKGLEFRLHSGPLVLDLQPPDQGEVLLRLPIPSFLALPVQSILVPNYSELQEACQGRN